MFTIEKIMIAVFILLYVLVIGEALAIVYLSLSIKC